MRYNIDPKRHITRAHRFFAGLVLASAMGSAHGQTLTAPVTPAIITPPNGHSLFLVAPAAGTQGYICLPTSAGAATASWTVKPSRPGSDSLPACLRTGRPDRDPLPESER